MEESGSAAPWISPLLDSIISLDARRRIAFDNLDRTIKMALAAAALPLVRITLGIVFLWFGALNLVLVAAVAPMPSPSSWGPRANAIAQGPVRSNLTRRLVEHGATLRASVAKD